MNSMTVFITDRVPTASRFYFFVSRNITFLNTKKRSVG